MNTIARLWKLQQLSIGHWDRLSITHKRVIRQSFIAGCEAMRDEMNCPIETADEEEQYIDRNQIGLTLVGGSDHE